MILAQRRRPCGSRSPRRRPRSSRRCGAASPARSPTRRDSQRAAADPPARARAAPRHADRRRSARSAPSSSASRAQPRGATATRPRARWSGRAAGAMCTAGGVAAAIGQVDRILELLGAARAPGPPGREATSGRRGRRDARCAAASRGDEILLGQRVRDALGPVPAVAAPPFVGVVIVSRSSAAPGGSSIASPRPTTPRSRWSLVDNASPAGEVSAAGAAETRVAVRRSRSSAPRASPRRATAAPSDARASCCCSSTTTSIRSSPAGCASSSRAPRRRRRDRRDARRRARARERRRRARGGWRLEQRGITISSDSEGLSAGPPRRRRGRVRRRFGVDTPRRRGLGRCLLIARRRSTRSGGSTPATSSASRTSTCAYGPAGAATR